MTRWLMAAVLTCCVGCTDSNPGGGSDRNKDTAMGADSVGNDTDINAASSDTQKADIIKGEKTDAKTPAFVAGEVPMLVASEPKVITSPGGIAIQPALALDANMQSLLVFTGAPATGDGLLIYGLRETGDAFPLSELDGQKRNEPSVCALANGGFVAVWSVDTAGAAEPSLQIGFSIVSDTGPSKEQRVTTAQEGNHWLGHVACTADGGFVIAGVRPEVNDPSFAAFAQTYDASGQSVGKAVTLNSVADATETQPVVAVTKASTWTGWSAVEGNSWLKRAFTDEPELEIAVSDSGGMALAADYRVDGALLAFNIKGPQLKVRWLPEEGAFSDPVNLDDDGAPGRHTAAITLLERNNRAAMIYQTFQGANSRIIVRYIGASPSEPLALSTGKFPPYTPAISYRGGALVAAWTEPDKEHNFSIRMIRW